MPLQPVERRSASAAVFDQLVSEVLDGGLKAGDALPPERDLTGLLAVNRQAVREALQRLAQAGLIEITHGNPTKVLDYRRSGGLDLLPKLLADGDRFDPEVVRSVMEMRASVGPDVARLAALRASSDVHKAVQGVIDDMRSSDDVAELAKLDVELWDLLVDGSGNIAYRLSFNGLRAVYEPVMELVFPVLREELLDLPSRTEIGDALVRRDGAAAEAAARRLLAKGTVAMTQVLGALAEGEA